MNDDLISRSKLIEDIEKIHMYIKGLRSGKSVLADMLEKYAAAVKEVIKEQPTAYDVEKIYNKAIDDFADKIATYGTYDDYGNVIDILEIAEKLKEGGRDEDR